MKEYKDLTEQEKLIINMRRADSWKYATFKLWQYIFKEENRLWKQ